MPGSSLTRKKRQNLDVAPLHEKRIRIEPEKQIAECDGAGNSADTDEADKTCRDCRKIDFEGIFGENRRSKQLYKIWGARCFPLPHIHPQSSCPMCRFFYHARTLQPVEAQVNQHYYLRVFHMRGELGAWQIDFDDSPGFAVVPAEDIQQYRFNYQDSSGIIMELSNASHALSGRQIHPRIDISLIKGWLEFCDKNHRTLCKKVDPRPPHGFCVIDCSTRRIVPWEFALHPKSYVTLSYVWGSQIEDITVFRDCLPKPLPATIEDAILLTKLLGYQYLWIDRYCIPQDNHIEKKLQIQRMDAIYEQSVVTIIAAAGEDPFYGLPGVGARPRQDQPHLVIGSKTLVATPYVKNAILESKWNSRGWTYQEGLLSPRKLVLTDTQVYFQCNSMHCLESIYAPLELLHTLNNNRMRDKVEMCRVFPLRGLGTYPKHLEDRLNEYLQRSLAFQQDIIDAFRGVLNSFEHKFSSPVKSICGIPLFCEKTPTINLERFIFGLLWRSVNDKVENKPKRRQGFPSWTWAGWELSQITFCCAGSWRDIAKLERLKSLVDVSVEYPGGLVLHWYDNQDQILAQEGLGLFPVFLRIYGPTLEVQIYPDGRISSSEDDGGIVEQLKTQLQPRRLRKSAVLDTCSAYNLEEDTDQALSFTLLIMGHCTNEVFFMLLYQPENSVYFERIGSFDLHKIPVGSDLTPKIVIPESLQHWTQREVLIG